jgi:hypothetical protein
MEGNSNTNPPTQFIGNIDSTDLVFKTNNSERLRIKGNGNMQVNGWTGTGFKLDSISNKSYKFLLVDEMGNCAPPIDIDPAKPAPSQCDYSFYPPIPWTTNGNFIEPTEFGILGTCNRKELKFMTSGELRGVITVDGKYGIGTLTPQHKLEVDYGNILIKGSSNFTQDYNKAALYLGDTNHSIKSIHGKGVLIRTFDVTNGIFLQQGSGNVGIGTLLETNPHGYKLAVNGSIGAREVFVEIDKPENTWPDYVFEKKYDLLPLAEVEKYINKHNHLPDVPSASEVEKNGLALGSNQALLLKKIEELTLYVIELNKKNEQLQKEVCDLKKSK